VTVEVGFIVGDDVIGINIALNGVGFVEGVGLDVVTVGFGDAPGNEGALPRGNGVGRTSGGKVTGEACRGHMPALFAAHLPAIVVQEVYTPPAVKHARHGLAVQASHEATDARGENTEHG